MDVRPAAQLLIIFQAAAVALSIAMPRDASLVPKALKAKAPRPPRDAMLPVDTPARALATEHA